MPPIWSNPKFYYIMSNSIKDDLYYDQAADGKDAEWVSENLQTTSTDAILSCPSCFIQICFVCQHHTKFHGQFRALKVEHCWVDDKRKYVYGSKGLLQPLKPAEDGNQTAVYRLVVCKECGTKVGVIDSNDVYHLFHVLTDS